MTANCIWRLEAISNAAKNRPKTSFILRAGENFVGRIGDIVIPSVLCSREHCCILYDLDNDKVTVNDKVSSAFRFYLQISVLETISVKWFSQENLLLQSRNGTYITFSAELGTKLYKNTTTERPLQHNDLISFGFNTGTVYNINDKNAFIYRLVKECIECIALDDSDDDVSQPSADKYIEIANKVIDVPSESDSNYSGNECLESVNFNEESDSSSVEIYDSDSNSYSDSGSSEENFIVTKTIINCPTPTEVIALDDDESNDYQSSQSAKADDKSSSSNATLPPSLDVEQAPSTDAEEPTPPTHTLSSKSNSPAKEETPADTVTKVEVKDSSEPVETEAPDTDQETSKSTTDDKAQDENEVLDQSQEDKADDDGDKNGQNGIQSDNDLLNEAGPSNEQVRLAKVKQRLAANASRKSAVTQPQPLRKRRQTLTEEEYNNRKRIKKMELQRHKELRRARLAELGDKDKAKRDAVADSTIDSNRAHFVPKIRHTVSRGEQLCTDFLALSKGTLDVWGWQSTQY